MARENNYNEKTANTVELVKTIKHKLSVKQTIRI
jgi:hypothetical protein